MVVAIRKISGGKLVKISFTTQNDVLTSFKLYGDFFLHPETTLDLIEAQLIGTHLHEISKLIQLILDEHDAEFIGVAPDDIQDMIIEEMSKGTSI